MLLITKESVEAGFISEITKRNFHQLVEACKIAPISKENIKINYPTLLQLREVYLYLKEQLDNENKEDLARVKTRRDAYKNSSYYR